MFSFIVLIVGIIAGGIAAIAGFGIGSLLAPLFALQIDTGLAVAAVSIPPRHRDAGADLWPVIIIAAIGVIAGTLVGGRVLRRIPETIFRRVVSAIILALGFCTLYKVRMGFVSGG